MSTGAGLPSFAAAWMARQRWYQTVAAAPSLRQLGSWELEDPRGEAVLRTHLLLDSAGPRPTLYQVPLAYRREPVPEAEHALVGVLETEDGPRWAYDGPHDAAYATALLRLILDDRSAGGAPGMEDATAEGHRHPLAKVDGAVRPVASRVLRGEQSNTSIIYELADAAGAAATPVICKLFRALHLGENPDVVVQCALASAGCGLVPTPVGHVSGSWPSFEESPDPGVVQTISGQLAFAQEFLPGVEDAWRVALRAVESGEDFSAPAYSLGAATAEVHAVLARVFPTVAVSSDEVAELAARMRARLDASVAEVPSLAPYADAIDALIDETESGAWPPLQRIHGDYHLGQVVAVPDRGWVLLDFEGEPLRPLVERSEPDLVLRDLAGMLRSFDYAAASFEQGHPGGSAADWSAAARSAFLAGYASRATIDLEAHAALLTVLEIDKALYEAIYESRNRPAWLSIPVTAVSRLVVSS
jgi:maltokinase